MRGGQEPLAHILLVLLHLAEHRIEGPLIAQKGITEGMGNGLGWEEGNGLGC